MNEQYRLILKSLLICVLTFMLATYYKNLFLNKYILEGETNLIIIQLSSIIYYIILAFGVFVVLIQIGVQKETVITILATLGFTIGLSFQNLLSRGISGVYIMIENLYKIGDYIDTGKNKGYVRRFNFFNTILYDDSKRINIVVPNNVIDSNSLINYSK